MMRVLAAAMTPADAVRRRREWARATVRRLSQGLDLPGYGTPEWLDWPGDPAVAHRARFAALVVAAECWERDGDELLHRVAAEAEADRDVFERLVAWLEWPAAVDIARTAIKTQTERVKTYGSWPA